MSFSVPPRAIAFRRFPAGAALAFVSLMLAGKACGEVLVPRLVKDINKVPLQEESNPRNFAEIQGKAFFTAGVTSPGQVWQSDGTAAGTIQVPEPQPYLSGWDPRNSVTLGGTTYYGASLNDQPGLWKSDGSGAGLTSVGNLGIAPYGPEPKVGTVAGGLIYFTIGTRVWRSDGTSEGTFPVMPVPPFSTSFPSVPSFTVTGDAVYFVVDRTTLWRSAGTPETTIKVFGGAGFEIREVVALNGSLFFIADTSPGSGPLGPYVLMKTGGTLESTTVIGGDSSTPWKLPRNLTVWNGALYFGAQDPASGEELWRSDGSTAGTALVKDIQAGSEDGFWRVIATTPGWMYLDAWNSATGSELWRSDGTAAGTHLVKDLYKGPSSGMGSGECVLVGEKLYFQGAGKKETETLCVSDGTAKGTRVLKTFPKGSFDDYFANKPAMGRAGNLCLFGAGELWRSDGTPKGTFMLKDVGGGNADGIRPYSIYQERPSVAEVVGESYVFAGADKESNHELWKSDGSSAGTSLLKDFAKPPGEGWPDQFAKMGGRVWFKAQNRQADTFAWSSDGTPKGTRMEPGMNFVTFPDPEDQVSFDGATYFIGGDQFYRLQGPGQPPLLIMDDVIGASLDSVPQLVVMNGAMYLCDDQIFHGGLLRSDGTAAGTVQVKAPANPGYSSSSYFCDPVVMGGALYFLGSGKEDAGLWKSDGSTAGTTRLFPTPNVSQWTETWRYLTRANSRLFWYVYHRDEPQLWTSDGTAQGTVKLKSLLGGSPDNEKFEGPPVVIGDRVVFVVENRAHGYELWSSDGTVEGTGMLKDIYPGPRGAWPQDFFSAGGRVFFTANDGIHGYELWQTDGTAAGTVMVADVWPGEAGSFPQGMRSTPSGKLYFSASAPGIGRELWVMDLPAAAAVSVSAGLAGASGSLRVSSAAGAEEGAAGEGRRALLAYAFNLPPGSASVEPLVSGSGTAGYPAVSVAGDVLRVEYIRRRNAGLIYTAKCSTSLEPGSFVAMSGKMTVSGIDEEWERVVVEQAYDPARTPRLFTVVEVTGL